MNSINLILFVLILINFSMSKRIWKTPSRPKREEKFTYPTYNSWEDYKTKNNISIKANYRESRRKEAFETNLNYINDHNSNFEEGKTTFKMRATFFVDMEPLEYQTRFVKLEPSEVTAADTAEIVSSFPVNPEDIPVALDWRDEGFISEPENQKSCGSCYAFSVAGSMEGQIFKRINKYVKLSVQQLVDCSVATGNHGCSGGSLRNTLKYLEQSGGIMRDNDYPYTNAQGKCKFLPDYAIVNITTWAILPAKREELLAMALAQVGPIPISINAAPRSFQLYSEGIYDDPECKSDAVNHAMLLMGYTESYWILKNWWGKKWGEQGYMKIARGKNMCGLSNFAAYAVV